jgi:hypothetical protein
VVIVERRSAHLRVEDGGEWNDVLGAQVVEHGSEADLVEDETIIVH